MILQLPADRSPTEFVSRVEGSALLTAAGFKAAPTTLAGWPVKWTYFGKRAAVQIGDLFAYAESKISDTPPPGIGRPRKDAA